MSKRGKSPTIALDQFVMPEPIILTSADCEAIFDAIDNPKPHNEKLRKALKDHERRVISIPDDTNWLKVTTPSKKSDSSSN
jgi:hypothetical protein